MRRALIVVSFASLFVPALAAQRVGTVSQLMIEVIYPTSDAAFYVATRTPDTDAKWREFQGQMLMLAESGNLLTMAGYARDQEPDAKLMRDAGAAAYRAAKAKDVAAIEALSDQLYVSCTTCHMHYRPNYGRRPPPQ
jgi:hypothetical protein